MFTIMGTSPVTFEFERVFTIAEAAERLGISVSEAYQHVDDGSLSAFRVGRGSVRRHLRVTDDDLERFVRDRRVGPAIHAPSGHARIASDPPTPRRGRRGALPEGRPGAFLEALRARDGRA